jgi:MFS family permease
VGFGFLLAIPAWYSSVCEIDPTRRAASLGAVMTAQGLGAIVGATIGSYVYESLQPVGEFLQVGKQFGMYSPFVGCAFCLLTGWLISLRILRNKPSSLESSSQVSGSAGTAAVPAAPEAPGKPALSPTTEGPHVGSLDDKVSMVGPEATQNYLE